MLAVIAAAATGVATIGVFPLPAKADQPEPDDPLDVWLEEVAGDDARALPWEPPEDVERSVPEVPDGVWTPPGAEEGTSRSTAVPADQVGRLPFYSFEDFSLRGENGAQVNVASGNLLVSYEDLNYIGLFATVASVPITGPVGVGAAIGIATGVLGTGISFVSIARTC